MMALAFGWQPIVAHAANLLIEQLRPTNQKADRPQQFTVQPFNPDNNPSTPQQATPQENWNVKNSDKAWHLECSSLNTQKCRMQPSAPVFDVEGSKQLSADTFSITVEKIRIPEKKQSVFVLIASVSMSVLLSEGISVAIDGRKLGRLAIRSCHTDINWEGKTSQSVCIAPLPLNSSILKRFKAGGMLKLSAKTLSGSALSSEVSLFGFTNMYATLIQTNN